MSEVVDLLNEILDGLRTMNEKLDDIRGNEYMDGSLEDIYIVNWIILMTVLIV